MSSEPQAALGCKGRCQALMPSPMLRLSGSLNCALQNKKRHLSCTYTCAHAALPHDVRAHHLCREW